MAYIDTRIDATTRKFALLGERLPYTFSPQIHNSLFAARGVNAVYLPLAIEGALLPSAVEVLRAGFAGFNVTNPYKEAIVPFLDELSPAASAVGAVNTVVISDGGEMTGHLTDGIGLAHALQEAWMPHDNTEVLILGGGGTARVAAFEMLGRKNRVTLAVRNPDKAKKLYADLTAAQKDSDARLKLISLDELEQGDAEYSLLIHCTPLGTYPETEGCAVSEKVIDRCGAVFDVVYNPPQSRLLAIADRQGAKTANGFGMLFYQAVEAQRQWLGAVPPTKTLREIRKGLEQLL